MDKLTKKSCVDFTDMLASRAPVPGGGGAAALAGALGVALCSMVGNYTIGKKKYVSVEEDMKKNLDKCSKLKGTLLQLVEEDAIAFEPLSRAYAIAKGDPMRDVILEEATYHACEAPMEMMKCCCKAIDLLEEMLEEGNVMLASDVGCGAALCEAALESAGLNVFMNTRTLKNCEQAEQLEKEADDMLKIYIPRADLITRSVMAKIRGKDYA